MRVAHACNNSYTGVTQVVGLPSKPGALSQAPVLQKKEKEKEARVWVWLQAGARSGFICSITHKAANMLQTLKCGRQAGLLAAAALIPWEAGL
jgi:hypothetical protein